jgi:hypothetical protein
MLKSISRRKNMKTTLYHIKCSQVIAITKLRAIFDRAKIENYIFDGGIHVHLTPNQIHIAKGAAETVRSELEIGMLPSVKANVSDIFDKAIGLYSSH